ncbi:MAG: sulfurtransferase TusA family protein [Actinomycetota bacterium]|nr:sulfurtransferase TusA family protein [Actinomycetota bacterium]
MDTQIWLDERGRRCPLPIIALNRAAMAHPAGTVIALLSDDPAAKFDVPAWCRLKNATFLGESAAPDGGAGLVFTVLVTATD